MGIIIIEHLQKNIYLLIDSFFFQFLSFKMLPVHGSNNKSNGISGIPVVNKKVLFSVIWTLLSLFVIFLGFRSCSRSSYSYSLSCANNLCHYKISDSNNSKRYSNLGLTSDTYSLYFEKSDIKDTEIIRIDSLGKPFDVNNRDGLPKTRLGYSIKMKVTNAYTDPTSLTKIKADRDIIFMPYDMGRRNSRVNTKKILEYVEGDDSSTLQVSRKKFVNLFGLLMIIFGFVSVILTLLLGKWAEDEPKRTKKRS